jgi:hypothetical protein
MFRVMIFAAVSRLTSMEIRELNFGKRNAPVLQLMRVLRAFPQVDCESRSEK